MIYEVVLAYIIYIVGIMINFLFWLYIIKSIINIIRRKLNSNYFKKNVVLNLIDQLENKPTRVYNDVSNAQLSKFNTDNINELKDFFYNMFLEFENAYNNLDYNTMKLLSTKQLYNSYYTGISLDLKAGKKRIITDIEKKRVIIFELDSTIAKQIASVMIQISYISYKLDKKGYIISGSRDKKITERFEVMFRKDFERKDITKCPNCGAAIVGNKCEYCRSTVKNVRFKISSIKKIIDEK